MYELRKFKLTNNQTGEVFYGTTKELRQKSGVSYAQISQLKNNTYDYKKWTLKEIKETAPQKDKTSVSKTVDTNKPEKQVNKPHNDGYTIFDIINHHTDKRYRKINEVKEKYKGKKICDEKVRLVKKELEEVQDRGYQFVWNDAIMKYSIRKKF